MKKLLFTTVTILFSFVQLLAQQDLQLDTIIFQTETDSSIHSYYSMIDACHIIPFAESYNDTITNGIALSPNMHRAFDRGLISIDNDYRVLVSSKFIESDSVYSIRQFEGSSIILPENSSYYPSLENLAYHRERFSF